MLLSSDFRRMAREALRGKWLRTGLILLLASLLGATAGIGGMDVDVEYEMAYETIGLSLEQFREIVAIVGVIGIAVSLLAIFVGSIVHVGTFNMGARVLDGEKPRTGMLFPKGIYWKAVGLNLYTALLVSLWSLLFVIPGIIASYRYAMAPYLMAKNPNLGPGEAVNLSKQRMIGNKARLFSLELSFFGWALLCALPASLCLSAAVLIGYMPVAMALILLGFLASLAGEIFLGAYMHVAVCAFFGSIDAPQAETVNAYWEEDAEETGAAPEEEESFASEQEGSSDRRFTRLTADETVAKDVFMQHGCSRRRLREENMLEAYEALGADISFEISWIREYGRMLMAQFSSNPAALDGLLNLAGEYAMDDLLDRVLERIDRHIRQATLPDEEILNMAGRTLALISSGVFADREGYVQRKRAQVADMADRLERRLQENDPEGSWRGALALVRRMCEEA